MRSGGNGVGVVLEVGGGVEGSVVCTLVVVSVGDDES